MVIVIVVGGSCAIVAFACFCNSIYVYSRIRIYLYIIYHIIIVQLNITARRLASCSICVKSEWQTIAKHLKPSSCFFVPLLDLSRLLLQGVFAAGVAGAKNLGAALLHGTACASIASGAYTVDNPVFRKQVHILIGYWSVTPASS